MNILIACHCKYNDKLDPKHKHQHPPVYLTIDKINRNARQYNLYKPNELEEAKKRFGIANIDYIEKRDCLLDEHQHREWNKLPRKYDIIFPIHCPVYTPFTTPVPEEYQNELYIKEINAIKQFYQDVKQHLKPNGYYHIDFDTNSGKHWKQMEDDDYIRKVFSNILEGEDYTLDFIRYKNRKHVSLYALTRLGSLPFFGKDKQYFRDVILKFHSSSKTKTSSRNKTLKYSSRIHKIKSKKITRKSAH